MAPIVSTVEIDRPPEEVFAYVTDPSRFAEWKASVIAEGPKMVTRDGWQQVHHHSADRARRTDDNAADHRGEPAEAVVGRGTDGPVRADVDVEVEPLDDGARSRVTISPRFTGHGIGRLIVPVFVRPSAAKEASNSCHNLKQRLEKY